MTDEIRTDRENQQDQLTTADLANGGRDPIERSDLGARREGGLEMRSSRISEPINVVSQPQSGAATATATALEHESTPLFAHNEANELRGKWDSIQVGFVDEPRRAVEHADALVASTMQRLAAIFSAERGRLEGQ